MSGLSSIGFPRQCSESGVAIDAFLGVLGPCSESGVVIDVFLRVPDEDDCVCESDRPRSVTSSSNGLPRLRVALALVCLGSVVVEKKVERCKGDTFSSE